MNTADNQPLNNDPELEALLDLLRDTPRRDPRVVARGRAKFVSEVEQAFSANKMSMPSSFAKIFTLEWLRLSNAQTGTKRSMKLSYSVLLVAFLMAVITFSGMGVTAYAAQSALPGDALYQLKMSIEQTQVRLVADAANLAELHLEFAERRLIEISGLIAEGRYGEIERATEEFEYHVQQALTAMQTVAAGDPMRAQELAVRVTSALSEYAQSLSGMMINVPEGTRASMQRTINKFQDAGNMTPAEINENEDDSDNVAPVNSNDDNHQVDQSNQNGGLSNENESKKGEDSSNLNSNESEDHDENQDNENDNEEQSSNSNQNDDDGNQNNSGDDHDGDDNDNHHDDDNDNDNDRDGGDNHNGGGDDNDGDDNDGDD